MKRVMKYPLQDGGSILVEVDILEEGIEPAARGAGIAEATQTLEQALDSVKDAAQSIVVKLRDMPNRPDQVNVAFGIKLGAAAGAIITSSSVETNFLVTLTWQEI